MAKLSDCSIHRLIPKVITAALLICTVEGSACFVAQHTHRSALSSNAVTAAQRPSPGRFAMSTNPNDKTNNDDEDEVAPRAGTFFNSVPASKKDDSDTGDAPSDATDSAETDITASALAGFSEDMFKDILKSTKVKRSPKGFSKSTPTTDHVAPSTIATSPTDASGKSSFVGIGKPLNDVQNPEYDEQGYTLYADETTGKKERVFEALVDYPSVFKMKIIGKDDEEETFAPGLVQIVADSCGVDVSMVKHSKRKNGKWTSVTVHAPVTSADMLYSLYANVDKDPRVKFKF